jgi:hypothetical protein
MFTGSLSPKETTEGSCRQENWKFRKFLSERRTKNLCTE